MARGKKEVKQEQGLAEYLRKQLEVHQANAKASWLEATREMLKQIEKAK